MIVQAWNRLTPDERKLPLVEQAGHALRHAGVSITVTSITDMVAFGIGATTVSLSSPSHDCVPMSSVVSSHNPCAYFRCCPHCGISVSTQQSASSASSSYRQHFSRRVLCSMNRGDEYTATPAAAATPILSRTSRTNVASVTYSSPCSRTTMLLPS